MASSLNTPSSLFSFGYVSPSSSRETGPDNDGVPYERLVIALVFLRCLRKPISDFELTSDRGKTWGKFDDVVVTSTSDRYALCVQLKHRVTSKLKAAVFFRSSFKKRGFNIEMYHESFKSIKKQLSGKEYALVLSTNATLDKDAYLNENAIFRESNTKSFKWAELLDTGGTVYQINPYNDKAMNMTEYDFEFAECFFLFCGQKNRTKMHENIVVELRHLLGPSVKLDKTFQELCKNVKAWKDRPRDYRDTLTGSWTMWQHIVRHNSVKDIRRRRRDNGTCRWTERPNTGDRINDCCDYIAQLEFCNVGVVREHVENANPAYVRPLSADTMALSVTKVHQAICSETHILVNVERFRESRQSVLRQWGSSCRWLVLIDDSLMETEHSSDLVNAVTGLLEDDRRLVVVSMTDKESFQDSFWCGDIINESWDNLLLTKIRLNGNQYKCRLGDIVSSVAELKTLLKKRLPCLIALAMNVGYIKLGQPFDPLPANYVDRKLVTRQQVEDEFFSSLTVRDVCIMVHSAHWTLPDKLSKIIEHYKQCSFEELEGYLAFPTTRPILVKVERFDIVAIERVNRKYKGLHMYLVKHTHRGWDVQRFLAGNSRIRPYVREQRIQLLEALEVVSNKIIVEGSPGVGKSTMLLDLASKIKVNNPTSWILRINLREFYEKFDKGMTGEEISKLVLRSMVCNEGNLADLEYSLLQHCLETYNYMICLVDSYDEMCPDYTEQFLQALRLLSPCQGKLVVTTRPAGARLLEDHLGSLAHLLPAFRDHQLQKYFEKCRPTASSLRVDTLETRLKELLMIPLFAEMYRDLMEDGTGSYDTVGLYEAFLYSKFIKQFGAELSDPGEGMDLENLWRCLEAKLKHLAGLLLVRNGGMFWQLMRPSVDDIFVKFGIVNQVAGEMPLFAHRTFGEYFLAKWCFSDASQKTCARVYKSAHSGSSLEFFLEVFDRMAGQRRPLVSAVLDGDERRVGALLEAGVGLAERDVWGRSALHLAAAQGAGSTLLDLLCARMRPALAEEDGLVHWTPLQYAANRGHWGAVEALLQAGADLTQLGNVQDAVSLLLLKSSLKVNAVVQNVLVSMAERYGHLKVLYMLWEIDSKTGRRSVDVEDEDQSSRFTALHIEVQIGDTKELKRLIMQGEDLNAQDENGETALHWAASRNRVDCTKVLIEAGIDLEVRDNHGQTALHSAVEAEASDIVKLLIEAGAVLEAPDKDGRTALHYTALHGRAKCCRLLVDAGASVRAQDNYGAAPLHYVGEGEMADIIGILIQAGARLHQCDNDGKTALHYAAAEGTVECASLLVSAGADVNVRDKAAWTPLHCAAEENAAAVIELLLESGASLHSRNARGVTALHYAASQATAEGAQLLIGDVTGVNAPDKDGATPLHYAARAPNANCASLLVSAGADIRQQDRAGLTALHYAARVCNAECISFLIRAGIDVNVRDNKGATPLHCVAIPAIVIPFRKDDFRESVIECTRLLLALGAYSDSRDERGKTPLHYAASARNAACVGALMDAGCDVLDQDAHGEAALHSAVKSGSTTCLTLLLRSLAASPTSIL